MIGLAFGPRLITSLFKSEIIGDDVPEGDAGGKGKSGPDGGAGGKDKSELKKQFKRDLRPSVSDGVLRLQRLGQSLPRA